MTQTEKDLLKAAKRTSREDYGFETTKVFANKKKYSRNAEKKNIPQNAPDNLKEMATHPIILYPKGIRNANKLPVEDLRQLAKFNRVVLNSIKMDKLLQENHEYSSQSR